MEECKKKAGKPKKPSLFPSFEVAQGKFKVGEMCILNVPRQEWKQIEVMVTKVMSEVAAGHQMYRATITRVVEGIDSIIGIQVLLFQCPQFSMLGLADFEKSFLKELNRLLGSC